MFLLWVELKKYIEYYKEMISDLYKSGMTISEISSEYGIAKSTINGWIKTNKEIKVSEDEIITLK
ncbi:helix-turn-helix domain-containing protein [Clostridium sp.]|uniref:helix-turn-helix domain-containing protein n=1 Tax=Clostridium sp. TaxID=1506 RepID=UPI00260CFAB6|nr:helix-turn-helix domain-containing protein [Clostridium sp.]